MLKKWRENKGKFNKAFPSKTQYNSKTLINESASARKFTTPKTEYKTHKELMTKVTPLVTSNSDLHSVPQSKLTQYKELFEKRSKLRGKKSLEREDRKSVV